MRLAHCKRGPERCGLCRDLDQERICLLEVAGDDRGLAQRRVVELDLDGERVWREVDVVRVFVDSAPARAFATREGVDDVDL
jgi:hypothetical protein